MDAAVHIIVQGSVQGVGFRYFVYKAATQYQLKGFVANLFDGNVEIEAEGERSLIDQLLKEVKVGPRAAHVATMQVTWMKPKHQFSAFDIR